MYDSILNLAMVYHEAHDNANKIRWTPHQARAIETTLSTYPALAEWANNPLMYPGFTIFVEYLRLKCYL